MNDFVMRAPGGARHAGSAPSGQQQVWRQASLLLLVCQGLYLLLSLGLGLYFGGLGLALGLGLLLMGLSLMVHRLWGDGLFGANLMAALAMAMVALHIQLARGLIELHFGVFVTLAFLLVYRHWAPIVSGALAIAIHHVLFDRLQAGGMGVYCLSEPGFLRVMLHAGYVVAQTAMECLIALEMYKRMHEQLGLVGLVEHVADEGQIRLDTADQHTTGMAARLQQVLERIHGVVHQVKQAAISIDGASAEIAAGNQDLSVRTEKTAASLQSTASQMDTLTQAVGHTAGSAREAHGLAGGAAEAAQRGSGVVQQVIATMQAIDTSAGRIADITGLIDSIAFQTNILALNAAVEAARAGEQGKGFAVVASEVRTLAQRSAEAARDIKSLIAQSTEQVAEGSSLVGSAGEAMREIEASVEKVAQLIGDIAGSAAEQSDGIARVNQAIAALDQATQQNAALVEQSAAAAESLREQAQRLSGEVSAFQTRGA
ncbi:MAG: chemotaxis protein [Roseateles depolymerans]|uniref:Chemotaxis protein n=1 Tax=Roseateles depolymerans TaxID=76731 RepID=A0A2W5DT89_9BURK|nr:MAG: chemotaxis protein [Roseateles depolymerans]